MDKTWITEKLKQQSEFIVSLLTKKMDESEKKITDELGREIKDLQKNISDINNRVVQLESSQSNIQTEIVSLTTEVNNLKLSLYNVTSECEKTKTLLAEKSSELKDINTQFSNTTDELSKMKQSFDSYENRVVAKDAFIFGIPCLPNENLKSIFNLICNVISIKPPTITNIYRTRPKLKSSDSAIKIKFNSPYDKNYVLTSLANYRKNNKKQLCLNDIHLAIDGKGTSTTSSPLIHIRESLSYLNRTILKRALELKKCKQLSSVFTSRGIVYVKRQTEDTAVLVKCIEGLDNVTRSADLNEN